jgi:hypothetical protein
MAGPDDIKYVNAGWYKSVEQILPVHEAQLLTTSASAAAKSAS